MAVFSPKVKLNSRAEMPILGLGTWLCLKEDMVKATMKTALDQGYRSFDTAYAYRNEGFIGDALQEAFKSGKVKRQDVFITTKISFIHLKKELVREAFERSRKALKLDYIDLVIFHSAYAMKNLGNDDVFPVGADGNLVMDHYDHIESWKELEKLSDEGKVKSIGVSNYTKEHLEKLYNNCRIKPAVNQIECHVHLPHATLVKYCKSKNINVMAYAPLGTPTRPTFMANKIPDPILLDDPLLAELGKKYKKTPAQIALRWLIQRGIIAIPKSVTPSRMKENIDIFNMELCADDMQKINTIKTRTWYLSYRDIGLLKHQDYIPYPMD